MPINRLLKDKRTPEEIELLNKAFNHALNFAWLILMTRFATWSLARLSRSTRQAPREIAEMAWSGLAVGKAASVGGLLAHLANVAFWPLPTKTRIRLRFGCRDIAWTRHDFRAERTTRLPLQRRLPGEDRS
jgi:hypothetical protein